jgi:diaminohydroxyphosphoribosylaminopyrimidine deaminase/5-amino-6-(5-phosphoribosylamino)uracil reductase
LQGRGVDVLRSAGSVSGVDLVSALKLIGARGITRLMVEGGPTLAAALLAADLVDAAHIFRSPAIVGADGIDGLDQAAAAAFARQLRKAESEPAGADCHEYYERR